MVLRNTGHAGRELLHDLQQGIRVQNPQMQLTMNLKPFFHSQAESAHLVTVDELMTWNGCKFFLITATTRTHFWQSQHTRTVDGWDHQIHCCVEMKFAHKRDSWLEKELAS